MPNDHKVPQFYLKSFHIPGSPGLIYSYKRGLPPKRISISKKAGCEDNYYTVDNGEHAEHATSNNHILATFENHSAKLVRWIIQNESLSFSRKTRWTLAFFISTLVVRNPAVHRFLSKQIVETGKDRLRLIAADQSRFSKLMAKLEPRLAKDAVEETRQTFLEVDQHLIISLPETEENRSYIRSLLSTPHYVILARRIFDYSWHLVTTRSSQFFVTSDNPVIFLDPVCEDFFNLRKCPLFVPLSPKLAILMHPLSSKREKLDLSNDDVDSYVKLSVRFANQFVYSHAKSDAIRILVEDAEQDIEALNYQYNFIPEKRLKFLLKEQIIKI